MTSLEWLKVSPLICLPFFCQLFNIGTATNLLNVGQERCQPNYPKCGNYKIEVLTRLPSLLGMCPHWDDESRSVYFTDVFRMAVQRYFIDTGVLVSAQVINTNAIRLISDLLAGKLPTALDSPVQFLGFVIPSHERNMYVMNFGDELGVLTWTNGTSPLAFFSKISIPDRTHRFPLYVLFDGKVGPGGVLFFYTVPVPLGSLLPVNPIPSLTPQNQSSLFGICGGKQVTFLTGYTFGNGIGFSPNGECFYHDDPLRRMVYKTYFDLASCSMRNTSVLLDFGKENIRGLPDGLTVDNEGYLWVTCVTAGQIIKIDPTTGDVVCVIEITPSEVSDVTFGRCRGVKNGPLNCMYVTTGLVNATLQLSLADGDLLMISDFGAIGQLDKKVDLTNVLNSSP